jgi:hypothetical protein
MMESMLVRGQILDDLNWEEEYINPVGPPRALGPPRAAGPPWRDQYTGLVLPTAEVEEAMNAERASLAKFHVLKVVNDPKSAEVREACGTGEEAPTPIGTRWLLHRKATGKVKARLVAQQIKWTNDGMDTFAATATSAGARLLLAILMKRNRSGEDYVAVLGDVKTAFLHAALPRGHQALLRPPTTEGLGEAFWLAEQALYGLRESPRTFQEHFANTLKKRTWRRLKIEPMIFVHESGALMSVFADDLLLIAPRNELEKVKRSVDADIEVKWGDILGPAWSRYLGKDWRYDGTNVQVRVPVHYWKELLAEFGLTDCRPVKTPSELKVEEDTTAALDSEEHAMYRRAVGKVMYAGVIRPDVQFTVKELARRLAAPTGADWLRLKRLLRYLKGTQDYVLNLTGHDDSDAVNVYADANWAAGPNRRSTSGGCVFYHGLLLTTWSRTQPTVTLSTAEAELYAMGTAVQEGQFIQHILEEMGVPTELKLHSDSSAARAVVARRGVGKMRHLAARQLWLQDELREGRLKVMKVPSNDNPADLMTKWFTTARHEQLAAAVGLCRT